MPRARLLDPRFLVSVAFVFTTTAVTLAHAAAPIAQATPDERPTGQVVDVTGAAIVRARVRLVDASGQALDTTLTDDRGRFWLRQPVCAECRVDVSLPGFATATATGATGTLMRIVLHVAPIQEAVVVSGTRDGTPASQVATSTTVYTADDIRRRGAPTVGELLRSAPAVTVVRTGGLGGVTSLFVRGGDSSYNKVLLDGIPLNEPGGTFNFGNLTTTNLDRVEIARGAQSALFGSDAMASVVQLFTRRGAAGRPRVDFDWEGGSYATRRVGANVSGGGGPFDYAVAASHLGTDNRVPNNTFDNTTISWNAGTDAMRPFGLRLVGRLEQQTIGTPGATAFGRPDLDAFFERADATIGVTAEHRLSRFKERVTYAYNRSAQTSTNLVADAPYTPSFGARQAPFAFSDFVYDSHNILERHHVSYQADWRLPRAETGSVVQFLTTVVDVDAERASLEDRLAGSVVPASRNNVGVSAQYQAVFTRAAVVGGIRVEKNASFGTAVVPRLSATFDLHDGTGTWGRLAVKANAGLGVKEPTILQSFSPSPFFRGNPDLEPERSQTYDVGLEQRLGDDRVKLGVVWFSNRYRNQISTRTTNPATFEAAYFNIGRTEARGVEWSADIVPVPEWRVGVNYTFLASSIVESTSAFSPVFAEGAWAFRRPRHAGAVEVGWTRGAADVALFGRLVGRRSDSDFASLAPPILEADGYTTWSLTARYRLRVRVDLTLRIDNLTGTSYMEPVGFPAWGRTAHVGVGVRF